MLRLPSPDIATASVGDMIAAGITHLRIECTCAIACVPWAMMGVSDADAVRGVVERMRCTSCGARPPITAVSPWSQALAASGIR